MPTLTHIPKSPKRRSEERGCASLEGLEMSDKGRLAVPVSPLGRWLREKLSLTFLKGKIVRLQLFLHFLPGKKTMKKLLNFF